MNMRNAHWIALGALIASLGLGPAARASLLLTAQPVTASEGAVNSRLNVYLTNIGSSPVDVSAFNFEISTASTDIVFQESTTGTTLFPYIFAGNSLFGPVISSSAPGQTLDASDLAAVSFTVVNPGGSFGLGEVSFDVASNAPAQNAPVDFTTSASFTSVSDQNGNIIPLQFSNGQITITPAATVPEPSSAFLLLTALAGLLATPRLDRLRR
jgi:hypothetical protein